MTRRDSSDIAAIMAAIPGWERKDKYERVGEYGPQKEYVRTAQMQLTLPGTETDAT